MSMQWNLKTLDNKNTKKYLAIENNPVNKLCTESYNSSPEAISVNTEVLSNMADNNLSSILSCLWCSL